MRRNEEHIALCLKGALSQRMPILLLATVMNTRLCFKQGIYCPRGFPGASDGKESACNTGDPGSIPGSERSLEKRMATHSSTLAWRIPWTEEPGGLQSTGSQRVRHDWDDRARTPALLCWRRASWPWHRRYLGPDSALLLGAASSMARCIAASLCSPATC